MRKSAVIALLLSSTTAIQRHHHHHRRSVPTGYSYFATGMNGDEDLGQDITMKGEKFHYAQNLQLNELKSDTQTPSADGPTHGVNVNQGTSREHSAARGLIDPRSALAQKGDIRGPSTDGPTAGVYQWPTPPPTPAPIPGPFKAAALYQKTDTQTPSADGPTHGVNVNQGTDREHSHARGLIDPRSALAQKRDIRGPSTDGPTAGVYQWPTPPPAPAPIPGPFKASALFQKGDTQTPSADGPTHGVNVNQGTDREHSAARGLIDPRSALAQKGDTQTPSADGPTHGVNVNQGTDREHSAARGLIDPRSALAQLKEINHAEHLQSVAGRDVTDQTSDVVHTIAMKSADATPATNRDILGGTNNMWSYPKNLDPEMYPKAHIYGAGVTKESKENNEQLDADRKAAEAKAAEETAEKKEKASADAEAKKAVAAADKEEKDKKEADKADPKKAAQAKEDAKPAEAKDESKAAEAKEPAAAKEEKKALAQIKWEETPRQGNRDYVTANMWKYPARQTPDPHAAKSGPSAEDVADAEAARAATKAKADAAAAELEKKVAKEKEEADLKKSVKEGKAQAAKEEAAEKAAAKAAVKAADGKASLAQAHGDGLIDPSFQPHPILEDPIHNDKMQKIPAVAGPVEADGHLSETVWRSSVEGGDPNPEKSRTLIKNFPMFNYPAHNSAPQAPNSIPAPEAPAIAVSKEQVEASKAARAKEAAADAKSLAQKQSKDVGATGSADYGAHAVLDDTLHQDRKQKIQSVAGPDVTDQIGASVHASAMEGGDANPGDKRNIIGNNPTSFTPQYGVSTTKTAADIAVAESKAKGNAINAAAAAEQAEKDVVQAEIKAKQDAKDREDRDALLKAPPAKTLQERENNEKKLKALDEKVAAQESEQVEKSKEAIANADTKKDKDVTLLKVKGKK